MFKKLIGTKQFYVNVINILLPVIIQNFITSFVGLLDNIMVGQVGTLPMSGVSIVNQLLNVFNITVFGVMAAIGIYATQYAGSQDEQGQRYCFRAKTYVSIIIIAVSLCLFIFAGKDLIGLYLNEGSNTLADIETTLAYSSEYLHIMLVGLLPFIGVQVFASTLREIGETKEPMIASVSAVFVNFVLNYILIFGHFGFPAMGIAGAAIATVISRFVELFVIVWAVVRNLDKFKFLRGIFTSFAIPSSLIKNFIVKGSPLVVNEIMWSVGQAAISQCYSLRGLNGVAAINITLTIVNLFSIVNYGLGTAISIVVGHSLGAGKIDEAIENCYKVLFFGFSCCFVLGVLMFVVTPLFPEIYNTSDEVKDLAASLLRISSCMLPVQALYLGSYFTLRAGGKTITTFLFDSCYTCFLSFPFVFVLTHYTQLGIFMVYLLVQLLDVPKVFLGLGLVRGKKWANQIVEVN